MGKFDALFEDEDGLFGGTPQGRYWEMFNEINSEIAEGAFDAIIEKMAAMELMLMEQVHEEELNETVRRYIYSNAEAMEERKKSLYMELGGDLIYRISD